MKGKHSKKAIHTAIGIVSACMVLVVLVHLISMFTAGRTIAYTEISFTSDKIGRELDGYVLAFVTDVHAAPLEQIVQIAESMSARGIGLLVLGGDFLPGEEGWPALRALSKTRTTDGIYGVDGNKDDWESLKTGMETYGIHPLDNNGVAIRPGFYLAGVGDLWNREPNVEAAVAQAQPEDFVLLVSHNPDVSMRQSLSSVDLVLSGHTHGGQITLFGLWKPLLTIVTDYGGRFGGGWAEGADGTDVYVSRGVGSQEWAPRVFTQPEVVYLTLRAA